MTALEIQCPYCSKSFGTQQEVIAHSVILHPGKTVAADLEAKYPEVSDPQEEAIKDIEHQKKVAEAAKWNRVVEHVKFGGDNDKAKKRDGEEVQKNNAELLMELASESIELLFKDQNGFANAVVRISDHREVLPVENSRFKRYLAKLFWDRHEKVIGTDSVNNVSQILQAKAEYESETFPLNLRVAWHMGSIYYDLTDDSWRSVRISKDGWNIMTETPILFTRYKSVPQAEPEKKCGQDSFEEFLNLTNIKDKIHQTLIKIYIVSLFIPDIPHAILNLYGDKGSAKSMLYTLIKLLVDPSKPTLLTLQKDRNEFIQQLSHNWIAFYDNAKHVPDWLSDEACRACTGGGHSKRRLYSDDEDFIYDFKRCLGFNGINIALTEEDALDRSILIDLARIPNDKRRLEMEILASFEALKPKLLGYIFDILAKAFEIKETVQLKDLPRMADFALWGEAISRAMGNQPLEFINAYFDNIDKQNLEAVESHPLGHAIAKWVDSWDKDDTGAEKRHWKGSPQELLKALEIIAEAHKIDTTHRYWPKAYNSLSRRLNQIRSNLLDGLGIKISISRVTASGNRANTSTITVEKIPPIPPVPPIDAQKTLDGTGDTGHTGDNIPCKKEAEP